MSTRDVQAIIDGASAEITALQEFPKGKPGWRKMTSEHYEFHIWSCVEMYRGVGVAFRKSKWVLIERRQGIRGCWAKLRSLVNGRILWVASIHLPRNEPLDEFERFLHEMIQKGPGGSEPAVLLADVNTHQKWCATRRGVEVASQCSR